MKNFYVLLCLLGFIAIPANALQPPQMIVEDVYAFATTSVQKNGAIFFKLKNASSSEDRIVSAASTVAEKVELHTHIMDGGIMMMRKVDGYDIPAGKTVTLEPMGHHIMLMGLHQPLKAGETFPVTLEFEHHWPLEITVSIKNPGDME